MKAENENPDPQPRIGPLIRSIRNGLVTIAGDIAVRRCEFEGDVARRQFLRQFNEAVRPAGKAAA